MLLKTNKDVIVYADVISRTPMTLKNGEPVVVSKGTVLRTLYELSEGITLDDILDEGQYEYESFVDPNMEAILLECENSARYPSWGVDDVEVL